jgi:flagellar biogenesis protein FliO
MSVTRTRATRSIFGLVAASVIALTATAAFADDPPRPWLAQPQTTAPAPVAAPEPTSVPWRSSLLIGVSAALGAAAVWVRSRKGGLAKLTSSRELRVISTVRVGPKGHLVLAGIGDRAILLGVTDSSVRRIAWLPADSITAGATDGALAGEAPRATTDSSAAGANGGAGASTAMVRAGTVGGSVLESRLAPSRQSALRASTAGKGAFADILRKIGGRHVDAPPSGKDTSAAAALAELRRDSVQWSKGAAAAAAPTSTATSPAPHRADGGDLEQQAAGILKRRSRGRRA